MTTELTIRIARNTDIDRIVEMGRKFLLSGPYKDAIKDNRQQAEKLCNFIINNPEGVVMVSEESGEITGVLAFFIYEHYYTGERTASELIWYVEPEHRGHASLELLWAAEKMAYEMGATLMQLTAPTEAVGKIYERCHYNQVEIGYQTRLESRVKH